MTPLPRLCDFFTSKTNVLGEDANAKAGTRIVSAVVESRIIEAGGTKYGIQGKLIPSSGQKIFQVGEVVNVLFKEDVPILILGHSWRKAQFETTPEEAVLPGEYQNVEIVEDPIPLVKLVSTSQGDFALNLTDFIPEDEEDTTSSAILKKAIFCTNNPTLVVVLWRSFITSPSAGVSEGGIADPEPPRDEFEDIRWHFRIFRVSSGTKKGLIIKNIDEETGQPKTIQFGSDTLTEIKPELISSLDISQAEITTRRVILRPTIRHNSRFQVIEIDLQNGSNGVCRSDGSSTLTVTLAVNDFQEFTETFEDSVPLSPVFSGEIDEEFFFWCLEENGAPKIYTICLGDFVRRPDNFDRTYPWFPPDGTLQYVKKQHDNEGNFGNEQIGGVAGAGDLITNDPYRRFTSEAFLGDTPGLSFGVMDLGFPVRDVAQAALGGSVTDVGEPAVYLINLSQAKIDGEGIVFRNAAEIFLIEWENWRSARAQFKTEIVGEPVDSPGFVTSSICVTTEEHDFVRGGIRFSNSGQPWTIKPWKSEHEAAQGVNEISGVCNLDTRHIIDLGVGCAFTTILVPGTNGEFLDVPFGSQISSVFSPPNPILTEFARLSLVQFPLKESFLGGTGPGSLIRPIFELRPNQLEGSISRGQQNRMVEWNGGDLTELGLELTEGFPGFPTTLLLPLQVNKRFIVLQSLIGFTLFDRRNNTPKAISQASLERFAISSSLDELGFTDKRIVFIGTSGAVNLNDFGLLRFVIGEEAPDEVDLVRTGELVIVAQPSNVFKQQRGETSAIFPISLENAF